MTERGEALETAWRLYDQAQGLNGRVDTKGTFVLTLEAGAAAALVAIFDDESPFDLGGGGTVLFVAGVAALIAAIVLAALAVVPRFGPPRNGPPNFVHFDDARLMTAAELADALTERDVLPLISEQIVDLSRIARRKYRYLQLSIPLSMVGALSVGVGIWAG